MGRGRPRKPDAQKILEGDKHKDRIGGEVQVDGEPRRPKGLSKDAAWLWKLVVQKWMGEIDTAQLMTLCTTWELLQAATVAARNDPLEPDNRIAYCQYKAEFDRLAARFGMTPADRAKIRIPQPEKNDEKEGKYFGVIG